MYMYTVNCVSIFNIFSTTKPKKKLVDVYRAVFSLRREVFTNRPIPDSEGKVSSEDQIKFQACCNGICVTLMFLTCVIDAALPEETGVCLCVHPGPVGGRSTLLFSWMLLWWCNSM